MAGDFRPEHVQVGALLGRNDPPPVTTVNPFGRSPFLLVGDHCGKRIPEALGTLGLAAIDRERHIAWDIGTAMLGERLADRLDAVFVGQTYSRLVIDCNRDPDRPDAIPEVSDGTVIPGNAGLDVAAKAERIAAIHAPYQQAIADEIMRRDAAGLATILISLHSFTPEMAGVRRPWDIGILHDGARDRFALRLLDRMREQPELVVGDNEPYRMDRTDHTVPRHAFPDRPYAEMEIAQRTLGSDTDIERWSILLAEALVAAHRLGEAEEMD